jgi:hypothetical protein
MVEARHFGGRDFGPVIQPSQRGGVHRERQGVICRQLRLGPDGVTYPRLHDGLKRRGDVM